MPQFDTFSFFSQITWVFLIFELIFLINCYTFFPASAIVLKIRSLNFWYNRFFIRDQSKLTINSPEITYFNIKTNAIFSTIINTFETTIASENNTNLFISFFGLKKLSDETFFLVVDYESVYGYCSNLEVNQF
jgi:hypothetical protein